MHTLAAELETALEPASHTALSPLPGDVDLSVEAIAATRPDLEQLIRRLRADDRLVSPRGVALGWRLVRAGDSPLYEPARCDALQRAVRAALHALRT